MGSTLRCFCRLGLALLLGSLVVPAGVDAQSLWKRGGKKNRSSIYVRKPDEPPPLRKNDIVLVVVLEDAKASNDARLDTRRKLEVDLLLDQFVRFSGHKLKPDFSPQPNIEVEAERKLQANGKTDRNETIKLRVAARVVDVRDNGNLILEARKEKRINEERTVVVLTGETRGADVRADHTILSDRIADMRLAYHGTGPISRNAGWSWLTWIVDHIWPF